MYSSREACVRAFKVYIGVTQGVMEKRMQITV